MTNTTDYMNVLENLFLKSKLANKVLFSHVSIHDDMLWMWKIAKMT